MTSSHPIFLGISGGVDSAVAAYLLKKEGHVVEAVFMKNWEEDIDDAHCTAAQDLSDAQMVCDRLSIPLHVVNFSNEYWEHVFVHFLEKQRLGETPNPDLLCNKEIKFKCLMDYAKQQGAQALATGHYAILDRNDQHVYLCKAKDLEKDQSYFLSMLSEEQLDYSRFPIGHLLKTEVRAIAEQQKLHNHAKKDSTGICFIGKRPFKAFLSNYLRPNPGLIKTIDGVSIGEHDGLMFYTIGQRQGLKIGGKKNHPQCPWYVAKKDVQHNVLIVVQGAMHPALFSQTLFVKHVHWINSNHLSMHPNHCAVYAKIRYRQKEQACSVEQRDDENYQIRFHTPQRAITPGQAIVFYQNKVCLGCGIIALSAPPQRRINTNKE